MHLLCEIVTQSHLERVVSFLKLAIHLFILVCTGSGIKHLRGQKEVINTLHLQWEFEKNISGNAKPTSIEKVKYSASAIHSLSLVAASDNFHTY